jgi:uncharacterized protein YbcI
MTEVAPGSTGQVRQQLADALVRWHREKYGRGPSKARAHVEDTYALVLFREVGTTMESCLAAHGHSELVERMQRVVRRTHAIELAALVSHTIGREVEAVLSDHDTEHDLTALVFVFPQAAALRDAPGGD